MQRLYDFLRRHPTGVDGFWAIVLFGISAAAGTAGQDRGGTDSMALLVPVVFLLCLVIALRR
ncbi:sensor histidine kinase, partial [Streptomyces sp. NPDC059618]